MKTKILVVSAAAIIGAGAYMHGGHKPRCLLQLFASEKPALKPATSVAVLTDNANDPKKKTQKHHQHKNHDVNGHEKRHPVKKAI